MREIECKRVFEDENGKFRKNYLHHWKAEKKKYVGNAYQRIFLSTLQYHKHELEIARFEARAPRAGTVDVKRLIYKGNSAHLKDNLFTNNFYQRYIALKL